MVRLSKIYTKTGDDGTTGLGDGQRVRKTDLRVEAYGTVDEANAALGWCVLEAAHLPIGSTGAGMAGMLRRIQNELFDVGADLCCPIPAGEAAGAKLRITSPYVEHLEHEIDSYNDRLKPLDSFVLPGGSRLATALHFARTVVRRAERRVIELIDQHGGATNPETLKYLNRLSDLLFVLSRVANDDGAADVKWVAGRDQVSKKS